MSILRVFRIISILLLILAIFMLLPVIVALYYKETDMIRHFIMPIAMMTVLSLFYLLITKKYQKSSMSTREGFLFVTLSWVLSSAVGALPLYLSGAIPSFTDAYFETMSGFTTTGASILQSIETLPKSMLFWRSLTHWLGGMGIVVLTVAIFPLLGIGGFQLLRAEAPGPTVDKSTPRIAETAKILWLTYLILTVAETILLMIGGMDLFYALTHTFGTMATGGFSPKSASIGHYTSPFIHIVITVFMLLAGTNFILYFRFITGRFKTVFQNTELRVYLAIFALASLIITYDLFNGGFFSFGKSIQFASFQTASILTTTGYTTANFAQWPELSRAVLFILMFIGGCSGSTGGGIKVIRIVTLFKLGIHEMKHLLHPRGIFSMKIDGSHIKKDKVYPIAGFYFLYIALLLVVTLIVALAKNDILTSVSTALVTVGNIGPGFGKIGPSLNYSFYPNYVKWVLSFAMMAGRLELFTVLVIFTRQFWRK